MGKYEFDKGIPVILEKEFPENVEEIKVKIVNKKQLEDFSEKLYCELKSLGFKGKTGGKIIYDSETSTVYCGYNTKGIENKGESKLLGFNLGKKLLTLGGYERPFTIWMEDIEDKKINLEVFLEGLKSSDYHFSKYKSEAEEREWLEVFLVLKEGGEKKIKVEEMVESLNKVQAVNDASILARDLVNYSPEDFNSQTIEDILKREFETKNNYSIEYYREEKLKEENMNCHLAVNRASNKPALTVKITYDPKIEGQEEIVLVGKGLSYDSGGLSLKPSTSMLTMKQDMAGASVVLSVLSALDKANAKKKVVGYLCIAENMISGDAYRPDDILVGANGKTIHVKNTDAEGRLVLFDNLVLAEKENPNMSKIYSLATLTGSAIVQFGEEVGAMVGFNNKMKKELKKVGEQTEEFWLEASFHKYMLDGVKDDVADISNMGTPNQGCQKAGLFLTNALSKKGKKKYLHCDIAGPSYSEKGFSIYPKHGTGWGVYSFINLILKD